MGKYKEKDILWIIRWFPILFIIILSIIITVLEVIDNRQKLEKDIELLKKDFMRQNNSRIEDNVNKIIEHISYVKEKSEQNLKKMLKQRVYEAHEIANNIYINNQNKSKEEILKLIKDALREIRFNDGRGYFFMHDEEGNNRLYPPNINLENKNYANLKDIKGYFFVQKIIDVIKNKTESFDSYYWSKPVEEQSRFFKKIAFYKYFEPLNMTISAGEYLEDFEQDLKKEILSYIEYYNKNTQEYIFISDEQSYILAHKYEKLIGVKLIDLDSTIAKKVVNFKNNPDLDQAYIRYVNEFTSKKARDKVSFIKIFHSWKWCVGTGYYKDELENLIKNKKNELDKQAQNQIINIMIISLIATLVLLAITIYLSNNIRNRFISYNKRIIKQIIENRKKDTALAQQNKMASMGEMLANIAHQWRQPLSVISTLSSGLKMKSEFKTLEENDLAESLDQITNTTFYLSKTIDDFSNFFKKDKDLALVEAPKLWESTFNLLKTPFKKEDIEFVLDIEDCRFHVLRNELIQVILNIVNNSKDQFILKEIKVRFIFIKIYEKNEEIYIEIKDTAGGVNQNILSKIFEPYFTTKHKSQGTGIGLYMCNQIITNNINGLIEAKNVSFEYNKTQFKGLKIKIIIPK